MRRQEAPGAERSVHQDMDRATPRSAITRRAVASSPRRKTRCSAPRADRRPRGTSRDTGMSQRRISGVAARRAGGLEVTGRGQDTAACGPGQGIDHALRRGSRPGQAGAPLMAWGRLVRGRCAAEGTRFRSTATRVLPDCSRRSAGSRAPGEQREDNTDPRVSPVACLQVAISGGRGA